MYLNAKDFKSKSEFEKAVNSSRVSTKEGVILQGLAISGVDTLEKYSTVDRLLYGYDKDIAHSFTEGDIKYYVNRQEVDIYNYPHATLFDVSCESSINSPSYFYWVDYFDEFTSCVQYTYEEFVEAFDKNNHNKRKDMKTTLSYIITDTSISVFLDGEAITVTSDALNFENLREALRAGDVEAVRENLTAKKAISTYGGGRVKIEDNKVLLDGKELNNYLTRKLLTLYKEGFDITPLARFVENLSDNPSYRAREELYQFLEYGNLPITEDGHFIAYKKVRDDYKDIWSGQFDNSIGAVCEMDRKDVDDNSARTCSAGLHFASREYMKHYGGGNDNKVMALKINPADVVAIPQDYNNTKGRCCRYEVVAELGNSRDFDKLEDKVVFPNRNVETPTSVDTPTSSKVKGVTFDKTKGKWKAQYPTKPAQGSRHIGYYKTREEAEEAVRAALS
jgi:hypothetical protein